MNLFSLLFGKKSGILCSVCGKTMNPYEIYRSNENKKCCKACYLKEKKHYTPEVDYHYTPLCNTYNYNTSSSPLDNPEVKAKWDACPLPFPNMKKPRTRQKLVEQSKAFYNGQYTWEERRKFEVYRENMLKILDESLWNYQQSLRAKQKAEIEKAAKEREKQRRIQELKLEEERKQKSAENKKEWLEHLDPFVFKHAKTNDCAEQIYAYIRDIVQMNKYPNWGKNTKITDNTISIESSSFACSFFDDGGSDREECTFMLWYAEDEGKDKIANEKINNPEPYDQRSYTHSIHDFFYCQDPLGLSGVYGFCFNYEREIESPTY